MDSYEISRLTDFDFEAVCKDLFERYLDTHLEIFAPGRDAGVDLRHCAPKGAKTIVVQCKRWDRNADAALYRHMRDKELPKIVRLNPDRYILATSVSLSKGAKDKLAQLLHPYVTDAGDIFGLHEIEALLGVHSDIVQRHLRLWLSSTAVLQAVLNKSVVLRSADLVHDITEATRLYVPNDSYNRAQAILQQHHYCIIAGLPGIGKTTLARVLSAAFADAGYDIFEVSEDANEINDVWIEDAPQFFYYDDFLGQTTLADKLHKNEDARLLRLFKRVAASPNKRFVLSTREYILESARQHYERIAAADSELLTCVIDLGDYTQQVRAEILYNHVYYSDLPPKARAAFAAPTAYLPIIGHTNFNPRLVERSLHKSALEGKDGLMAARSLLANLEHPSRLWDHIVTYQLDSAAIAVLVTLFSLDGLSYLNDLGHALRAYTEGAVSDLDLKRKLKLLDSTMIRILAPVSNERSVRNSPRIGYHNPSIRDFMRDFIGDNPSLVKRLFESAVFFEQLITLWDTAKGWKGTRALDGVRMHRDVFVDALMRTYPGPPTISTGHLHGDVDVTTNEYVQRLVADNLKRLRLLIEICEDLGDGRLIAFTAECIAGCNLYQEAADGSELASIVRSVWKSPIPEIARYGDKCLAEAVEWITADLYDWDNVSAADQALEDLGDIAPDEVRQEIEDAYDAAATRWLELFEHYGRFELGNLTTIEQIVDRAESLLGPGESVLKAREEIRKARSTQRDQKLEAPKQIHESTGDATVQIQQMLASLRES
ncbi:restriction endonuclease [Nonomuraea sp. NPDC052265]|uniref:nSTAND3 domain-containing NTPase n=1 Tax=Nonomuraea sp. NPDC052265 TaxID=3364374 RepID=UPI0037C73073